MRRSSARSRIWSACRAVWWTQWAGVVRLGGVRDPCEGRIQQVVADRRRVDEDKLFQVGVDPVLQRQVHQHRARKGAAQRPVGDVQELPALVVEQKQHDLFGESQHRPPSLLRFHNVGKPAVSISPPPATVSELGLSWNQGAERLSRSACRSRRAEGGDLGPDCSRQPRNHRRDPVHSVPCRQYGRRRAPYVRLPIIWTPLLAICAAADNKDDDPVHIAPSQ